MYLVLITLLGVASLSATLGTTEIQETPQALPLITQTQPTTGAAGINNDAKIGSSSSFTGGEIWQEDDREVLIRNERGTKQNNGNGGGTGTSGKRGKSKKNKNIIDSMKEIKELHVQTELPSHHHQLQQQQNQHPHQHQLIKQIQQQQQQFSQLKQQNHQLHGKHTNRQNVRSGDEVPNKPLPSSCRYVKSPWTECDPKTNMRTRTLTLKKGEGCDQARTIEKKCKKACRYEKGAWSECTGGQITRTDKLKSTSDSTCLPTRVINKNCNTGKSKDKSNKERKNKDKGARKGRA